MLKRSNLLSAGFCALIALVLMATGCSKKDSSAPTPPPAQPANPKVNSVSAASANAGDTLVLYGQALGTDTTKLKLSLNDTLSLRVYQVKDSVAYFILPTATRLAYIGSRNYTLYITDSSYTVNFPLAVVCPQPHGWFFAYSSQTEFQAFVNFYTNISIAFANDTIGYAHGYNYLVKTRDGGLTWNMVTTNSAYGSPFDMAVIDTANVWIGTFGGLLTSTNGAVSFNAPPLPSGVADIISGIYATSPTTGEIAGAHGEVYDIKGSFDTTSGITPEFKSAHNDGSSDIWAYFTALDANNAMAVGRVYDGSVVPGVNRPFVSVKTNGVYDEYTISPTVTTYGLSQVQLLSNSLGFALDNNYDLLKYTGNRTWSMLSQKANGYWFANADTGYAAYNGAILQTVDGGQTWNSVFTLAAGDYILNFTGYNGKIWAIGENTNTNTGIIYKYNP